MPLIDFKTLAAQKTEAWKSSVVGEIGTAKIKILRMDAQSYDEEIHDYDEALLVIDGKLLLKVAEDTVVVESGQMYLAIAGTPHAVLPGSHGSLVIIDV